MIVSSCKTPCLAVLLVTVFAVRLGQSARILAVLPVPSVSHQVVYHPLLTELARRGHDVVFITPNPISDPPAANYTQIDVSFLYNHITILPTASVEATYTLSIQVMDYGDMICEKLLENEIVRKFISSVEHFDLVFVEQYFTFCPYAFAHKYSAPMIYILSMPPFGVGHDTVGNPTNPSYLPEIYSHYSDKMTFLERMDNFIYSLRFRYYVYSKTLPRQHAIAERHFGPLPSFQELHTKASMLFICYEPSFHPPRPQVPAVVQLTGLHLLPPKPLPKDVQQFLDSAPKGAIYVSLGSNIRSDKLGVQTRQMYLDAFAELKDYHVLWKWESDNLPGQPSNVKIQKWFPQHDILRHSKVKVFIMQGGLQSLEEAIDCGVPVIATPFFSDQFHDLKRIVEKGIGVRMDYNEISKEKILSSVKSILEDQSFRENMQHMKKLITDQPHTSLERAVWWTEYVIRHKGAAHLRTAAVDMPWYQYLLLDVVAFLLVSALVPIFLIWKITKFLFRRLFSSTTRKVKRN